MLKLSCLWYNRLRYANFKFVHKLMRLSFDTDTKFDHNHKCEIYVESKLAKTPFYLVQKNTAPLELIHSNICDLKFVQTKGEILYYFY